MWFGSAQWFYNLATWLHDIVDALWMVGNDIDERNGVIPSAPHAPPCSSGRVFDREAATSTEITPGMITPAYITDDEITVTDAKLTPVQDTAESIQADRGDALVTRKGTRQAYPWNR